MKRPLFFFSLIACGSVSLAILSMAQPPGGFGFGRGGPGMRGPGGPGGPGGPHKEERKILETFDQNENGWLENDERALARKSITTVEGGAESGERNSRGPGGMRDRGGPGRGGPGRGGPGRGGPGRGGPGGGGSAPSTKPGPAVSPDDVDMFPNHSLYDTSVVRTLFLQFDNDDWEIELEDFHGSDVDVPADLIVDGKTYPNVGVHFRGMSSYSHVSRGAKRSFNVSLDMADEEQRIGGYKTLNLLNGHGDPSMMSTVVYSQIARQYIPAPKANFVHVVVNGKSWGTYVNVQQFDKIFLNENFESSKGTRWKVNGNPSADGGLRYVGDDLAEYKSRFEMKSNDGKKAWNALMHLCRTLNETPISQLQSELDEILDIDGTLKFLALDNALVNGDGYWTRASDYSLFRDQQGKFHIMPHDMNEAFALANHGGGPGGPGGRRGPGGPGGRGGFGFGPPDGFGFPDGFGPPRDFGGPEGRGPDSRGPDSRGPDSRGPDSRGPDSRGPDSRGPDSRGPDSRGPDSRGPDSRGPDSRGPEGRGPEGRGPEGRGPEGRGPEGRGPEGRGVGGRGPGGGGPGGGGPGHGGTDLDPLVGLDNPRMPLRSRLLQVPELRARYMEYVDQIARESLDWKQLGAVVEGYRDLISPIVMQDTRKLDSFEAFDAATKSVPVSDLSAEEPMSLQRFSVERSGFLLKDRSEAQQHQVSALDD